MLTTVLTNSSFICGWGRFCSRGDLPNVVWNKKWLKIQFYFYWYYKINCRGKNKFISVVKWTNQHLIINIYFSSINKKKRNTSNEPNEMHWTRFGFECSNTVAPVYRWLHLHWPYRSTVNHADNCDGIARIQRRLCAIAQSNSIGME